MQLSEGVDMLGKGQSVSIAELLQSTSRIETQRRLCEGGYHVGDNAKEQG